MQIKIMTQHGLTHNYHKPLNSIFKKLVLFVYLKKLYRVFNEYKFKKIDLSKIKFQKKKVNISQLHPIKLKNGIDYEKIKLFKNLEINEPIFISKDFFIMDGHHRWVTSLLKNNKKITCYIVSLDAKDCIKLFSIFSITNSKKHKIKKLKNSEIKDENLIKIKNNFNLKFFIKI
jgi:hypothetical protein